MSTKAEQLKEQGNSAFKRQNYEQAINLYTQAIKCDNNNPIYYQNRATAYYQIRNYQKCVEDANQALQLDPNYVKAYQKKIEGLFKQNKLTEALPIAEQLYVRDQTSKTREIVTEVRRAHKLILSDTESFSISINNSINLTLKLIAQVIGYLSSVTFPILSTQKRQESMQEGDKYELEKCEIIQMLSNFRDQMAECGIKKIPDDYKFLTKSLPSYKMDPAIQASYFLLRHIMRQTAESFVHYQLEGFSGEEEEMKDPNFFLKQANNFIGSVSNKVQKLVLQTCFQLLQHNLDNAKSTLTQLVKADSNFNGFIQAYQAYEQCKERGTQEYKAGKPSASASFKEATLKLLNYEEIAKADMTTVSPLQSFLYLSAGYLAAQTLSNEGMAYTKQSNYGKALALLSAATFVDQRYVNAYKRAGQIYSDKQMYAESRIEYSTAQALDATSNLESTIKQCQQNESRYKRKDYYAILGVDKNIDPTSKEYQKKYKMMCVKWHPDSHQRGTAKRRFAEQKFRLLQEANGVLTDKNKKAIYDSGGDPNDSTGGAGGMDFSQFAQFAGSGGGRQVFIPMEFGSSMGGIDIGSIFSQMMGGGAKSGGRQRGGARGNPFTFDFDDMFK